jgi:hypothetical protein
MMCEDIKHANGAAGRKKDYRFLNSIGIVSTAFGKTFPEHELNQECDIYIKFIEFYLQEIVLKEHIESQKQELLALGDKAKETADWTEFKEAEKRIEKFKVSTSAKSQVKKYLAFKQETVF